MMGDATYESALRSTEHAAAAKQSRVCHPDRDLMRYIHEFCTWRQLTLHDPRDVCCVPQAELLPQFWAFTVAVNTRQVDLHLRTGTLHFTGPLSEVEQIVWTATNTERAADD